MENYKLSFNNSFSRSFDEIYLVLMQIMRMNSINPFIDVNIQIPISVIIYKSLLIYLSSNTTFVNYNLIAFIVQYIPVRINTKLE